jgi:phage shock protein E
MSTDPLIIDTREPFEFQASHIEGAINIPPEEFTAGGVPSKLADVAKDREIILYCRSGQRSNTCSMILRQYGFTNLVNGTNEHRVAQMLQG